MFCIFLNISNAISCLYHSMLVKIGTASISLVNEFPHYPHGKYLSIYGHSRDFIITSRQFNEYCSCLFYPVEIEYFSGALLLEVLGCMLDSGYSGINRALINCPGICYKIHFVKFHQLGKHHVLLSNRFHYA